MESSEFSTLVHRDDLIDTEEVRIFTGMVFKADLDGPARLTESIDGKVDFSRELYCRFDHIVIVKLQSQMGVVCGTHHLVHFLPRPDADDFLRQVWCDRRRQVDYLD